MQNQYTRIKRITVTLMLTAFALFTTGAVAQTAFAIAPGSTSAETPRNYFERGALTSPSDDRPLVEKW